MIEFRDQTARRLGMQLIVHVNPDGLAMGINPFIHGSALHTDIMKTQALRQALDRYGFDAAFGGARRDEEKSRAKERVVSIRSAQHRWDPKRQRPELWRLYNTRKAKGESLRVFPLSNWTELDIWQYIHREAIPIVPLYFAAERPIVERDGALILVDDERMPLAPGERPQLRKVRFRTLGCYPLTGAIESNADSLRGDHRGDAGRPYLRAPGPGHRPRRGRLDGDEEAGRILLMNAEPSLPAAGLDAWLADQSRKELLRFITCGSVDDGKSTLIGRLLYESRLLLEDQLAALESDSRRLGTQGGELDFALLVDGLAAEREQGITIDVAYRFFATERRKYIVADTPGHEQYTRNMVTGASTADLAIILVDARKGVLTQTRRHSYLVSLLGIRRMVLAVNKMDLVGYSAEAFGEIERGYREFAARIGLSDVVAIPVSALRGDNVIEAGAAMPWYHGPTLLQHLESVPVQDERAAQPFRMPVQWVNRPNHDFRGFAGLIVAGSVRSGELLQVQPSGFTSRVARIVTADGDLPQAVAGQSVTLTFEDAIDVSRGDLLVAAAAPAGVSDKFEATIVWMSEEPMLPGRPYLLKCGTRTVTATVAPLKYKINVNTHGGTGGAPARAQRDRGGEP